MQVTICDLCGTRDNVKRHSYAYDRESDAAGSMSDLYETFDLCPSCEVKLLRTTIEWFLKTTKTSRYTFNQKVIDVMKALIDKKGKRT